MELDRESIRRRLPLNLDELARETGALRRRREIKSAEQMLWMALIYSGLVGSLRATAAVGAMTGDFDINDTSVRYRLGRSAEFLTAVLNHLLFGAARAFAAQGVRRRICLQDATVLSIPGSTGTDFRLHTEYVPGQGLAYVEITDNKGGESLERGEYNPGDIVMADQGLGHARDIHHVHSEGADSLLRVYLRTIKLNDHQGARLQTNKLLDLADRGISSVEVWVPYEDNAPVQARLVMAKLPPEKAARAREKLKRRASKKQKQVTKDALRLAGYVVLLTTLLESELSDLEVLQTYRMRWQIELFFKRCKSLIGLDEVNSAGRVAQAFILGKLIIAALIDRAIAQIQRELPQGRSIASANLWGLTKLCLIDLDAAILAVKRDNPGLAANVLRHISEGPRKRKQAAEEIDLLYLKLNLLDQSSK